MRVVADSNALVFYLFEPRRLTDSALNALAEAEDTEGISASVASIGDLWYVSQKRSGSGILPGTYEAVRQVLADPSLNFHAEPIIHATMEHFDRIPHKALPDPFDRFIVATAIQLRLPLVTADRAISATGAVEVIW